MAEKEKEESDEKIADLEEKLESNEEEKNDVFKLY